MNQLYYLGHQKVADILIQNGANVNVEEINENQPLYTAAQNGNLRSDRLTWLFVDNHLVTAQYCFYGKVID